MASLKSLSLKSLKEVKHKKCRNCGHPFRPTLSTQTACGFKCAHELGVKKHGRAIKRQQLDERRRDRARLEQMKSVRDLIKEAQREFNAFVRERDRAEGCISCHMGPSYGGQWHAGHYRSTGAAPQLRFNEANVHKQCAQCNAMKSGNVVEYRRRLIERVGLRAIEAIESNNDVRKWTAEEVRAIRQMYRRKTRELRARRELGAAA